MKHGRSDYDRIQDPEGLIPKDEPVFLIRGQDKYAVSVVNYYADLLKESGEYTEEEIASISNLAKDIAEWPKKQKPTFPID